MESCINHTESGSFSKMAEISKIRRNLDGTINRWFRSRSTIESEQFLGETIHFPTNVGALSVLFQ
jgi:hypothetical protein